MNELRLRLHKIVAEHSLEDHAAVLLSAGLDSVSTGIVCEEGPVDTTVSIGVAGGPAGTELEVLLAAADTALYQAKRGGRNRVRDLRAFVHGDLGRRAKLASEGAENEKSHDPIPSFASHAPTKLGMRSPIRSVLP